MRTLLRILTAITLIGGIASFTTGCGEKAQKEREKKEQQREEKKEAEMDKKVNEKVDKILK